MLLYLIVRSTVMIPFKLSPSSYCGMVILRWTRLQILHLKVGTKELQLRKTSSPILVGSLSAWGVEIGGARVQGPCLRKPQNMQM